MSAPLLQILLASTRPGRVGDPVAEWFDGVATEHGAFAVELVDLAQVDLPLLDEPEHPKLGHYEHEHTKRWSAIVERGDAYVFVIPEYNHGPNAAVKNAIDYLHNEWAYKPAAFVSYGGVAAGTRSVEVLKQVLTALRVVPVLDAVTVPMVQQFIQEDGSFSANDPLQEAAGATLDELLRFHRALRSLRAPEDQSPRQVVERFYAAERRFMVEGADFDVFLPVLAEDVVLHQAENLPYGGEWRGHEGLRRCFATMHETWSELTVEDVEFFEGQAADQVVVSMRMVATARVSGEVFDRPMLQLIRVQDGRIKDFLPLYWDTAEVRRLTRTGVEHGD